MTPATYPVVQACGDTLTEYALSIDRGRADRLLVIPALFDEANRLRRLTVEVMRRLDHAGIDSMLPDLPGCNESLQALGELDLGHWQQAMVAAAREFRATRVLAIRGGALVVPRSLPGWRYAPTGGATILRQMVRMRILSSREAGREETQGGLLEQGLAKGLDLAGYQLSPAMIADLQAAMPPEETEQTIIGQDMLGGGALWLRAEPGDAPAQTDALAAIITVGIKA